MGLTKLNMNLSNGWDLTATNDFGTQTSDIGDSISFNLSGISLTVVDQLWANLISITPSTTVTINLQSLTNQVHESVVFTSVATMFVKPTGSDIVLSPSMSDPFGFRFGNDSDSWSVSDGGCFVFSEAVNNGVTVDNTHKNIDLTNNGSDPAVVKIVISGGTA